MSNPRVAAEDGAWPESRACLSTRLSPVHNMLQKLDLSMSSLIFARAPALPTTPPDPLHPRLLPLSLSTSRQD